MFVDYRRVSIVLLFAQQPARENSKIHVLKLVSIKFVRNRPFSWLTEPLHPPSSFLPSIPAPPASPAAWHSPPPSALSLKNA